MNRIHSIWSIRNQRKGRSFFFPVMPTAGFDGCNYMSLNENERDRKTNYSVRK